MKIPINIPFVGKEEISAVNSILKNGDLTSASNQGGKHVQAFEKSVSSFVNVKYAIAVNSGTAALQAALYALDIKHGDEVLIPSFTFVATANSVLSTGAKPVFVDILKELKTNGLKIAALGASTKGNVTLQTWGISDYIDVVGDVNLEKNGSYTPGTWIPIKDEDSVLSEYDVFIILPWHFKKFFVNNLKFKGKQLLFPLPTPELVTVS